MVVGPGLEADRLVEEVAAVGVRGVDARRLGRRRRRPAATRRNRRRCHRPPPLPPAAAAAIAAATPPPPRQARESRFDLRSGPSPRGRSRRARRRASGARSSSPACAPSCSASATRSPRRRARCGRGCVTLGCLPLRRSSAFSRTGRPGSQRRWSTTTRIALPSRISVCESERIVSFGSHAAASPSPGVPAPASAAGSAIATTASRERPPCALPLTIRRESWRMWLRDVPVRARPGATTRRARHRRR